MSIEKLDRILYKASKECRIHEVQLHDVTEPTLHRDLAGMIRVGRIYGPVVLSTNASLPGVNWPSIMFARPSQIFISISGDTQEVHERGHKGSQLEVVHKSMVDIAKSSKLIHSNTKILVLYHRYRYNLHEEIPAEKRARSLGFAFAGLWATMLRPRGQTNTADCVLSPEDALQFYKSRPVKHCMVLEQNLNIDVQGYATQCAGFGHRKSFFLDTDLTEIQRRRRADPLCIECARTGMAHYVCREPHLDRHAAKLMGDSWRYRKQRLRHWLFHLKEKLTR